MGFNVQGIALSKKYGSKEMLAGELKLGNMIRVGDTFFENASSSQYMEDNDLFITEAPYGTLLTMGIGFEVESIPLKEASGGGRALFFIVSEMAMSFVFGYYENGKCIRSVWHSEGEHVSEEGEPLGIELKETDLTKIIFSLIGGVTGTNFYQMEPGQKSEHYRVLET